jgi:hypothetical protein
MTDFEALLARAPSLAPAELPGFLAQLEQIRAVAWLRLTTPSTVTPQMNCSASKRLLSGWA